MQCLWSNILTPHNTRGYKYLGGKAMFTILKEILGSKTEFMPWFHKGAYLLCFCSVITALGTFLLTSSSPELDLKKQTFENITKIRAQKKQEVVEHFENIKKQAQSINTDQQMLRFFNLMQEQQGNPDLEFEIDKHYVARYNNFYDILFIDSAGLVFHSIKKESDYRKNIFTSDISDLKLVKSLKNSADGFAEYEYYPPSDEAAAFFSVPLSDRDKHIGWFVLQCETNNLNTILTKRNGLGRTGETYLVNKDKLMLSESRFMGDSTVLQLKVDTLAVKEAIQSREGEKILTDYRGVNVFSSFEMFDLFGVSWIIIVEIDEDEVITEHFKKHQKFFINECAAYLSSRDRKVSYPKKMGNLRKKKVEMNEFAKSEAGSYLMTEGVSTCTAIAISYPGKFGYLAHISPTDEIYIDNPLTKYFLQRNYHNFLSQLIGKIKHFEVYPYELNKLQFVIVATHRKSFAKAVKEIIAHDIELASIKFMYNPDAQSSSIVLAPSGYSAYVMWNSKKQFFESAEQIEDLGSIVKKIMHYDA